MKKIITIILIFAAFAVQAAVIGVSQSTIGSLKIESGNTYILPDGFVLNGQFNLTNVSNVTIKASQQGFLNGSIALNGTCNNILIENLDISGYNICIYVRSTGSTFDIIGCTMHDCTYGIWLRSNQNDKYNRNITIERCHVYNTMNDGIYMYCPSELTITTSYIHDVNKSWVAPETDDGIASGDGIQLILVDRLTIQYCKIDRSASGNKFCLIISGTAGSGGTPAISDNYMTIDNNEFILPIKTNEGGAGLYFYDFPSGTVVDFNFNTVVGYMKAIVWASNGTFYSNGNTYEGISESQPMPIAIELQRTYAKGISQDDIYNYCTRKGTTGVSINNAQTTNLN